MVKGQFLSDKRMWLFLKGCLPLCCVCVLTRNVYCDCIFNVGYCKSYSNDLNQISCVLWAVLRTGRRPWEWQACWTLTYLTIVLEVVPLPVRDRRIKNSFLRHWSQYLKVIIRLWFGVLSVVKSLGILEFWAMQHYAMFPYWIGWNVSGALLTRISHLFRG